ncbi:hypothetical protein [Desulfogranum japonicum]|uniref:hypothetical protein n=1 Tax=Desulfogranum japonicum TaxID=231447 RepID=UPI00041D49A5|nr:hypothetical protein [Desulfogranum japonicum]
MTEFKQQWDFATAMAIVQHPTVDSKTWAEAVEWLLIYGPPEIREMLTSASGHATKQSFPDLQPVGYDAEGSPCYTVHELAQALDITEEEAAEIIAEKEEKHGVCHHRGTDDTSSLQ